MKKAQLIAGGLLGLIFVVFGANFFLKFIPIPAPPEGSPPAQFMGVLYSTGFLAFVKVLEITGGVLTAIPRTRLIGLAVLTPIVVNILAFHVCMTAGAGLVDPAVLLVTALTLFLLFSHRKNLAALLTVDSSSPS